MTLNIGDTLAKMTKAVSQQGYRDSPFSYQFGSIAGCLGWLQRQAVYRIPEDAFKKGYSWQGTKDQINKIEKLERKFKIKQKKKEALALSRLDGEGYIYYDVNQGSASKELNLEAMRADSLRFVNVIRRQDINPSTIDNNPLSRYYGQPVEYTVSTKDGNQVKIHASRIARFVNHPDPDTGRGQSILVSVGQAISDSDNTRCNVSSLVEQSRLWVMGMKDLMQNLDSGPEAVDAIAKRYTLFAQQMTTNGVAVTDLDNEKLDQKTTSFATLPDVMKSFDRTAAAALEIPYALLWGREGGLGTNGDMELKEYYDNVAVTRVDSIDGPCEVLDEVLIRSALGSRPDSVFKTWNSLFEMTDAEKAKIALDWANAAKTAVDGQIVTGDMMTRPLINAWVESGAYPGIEEDITDADIDAMSEDDSTADDALGRSLPQAELTDSILEKANAILDGITKG